MTDRRASAEHAETRESATHGSTGGSTGGSTERTPLVRVRYWAGARAAAGVPEESVEAQSVADALAAVRARHADEPRFDKVLSLCTLLLGESPLGGRAVADLAEIPVADGDILDVLPPFAGG